MDSSTNIYEKNRISYINAQSKNKYEALNNSFYYNKIQSTFFIMTGMTLVTIMIIMISKGVFIIFNSIYKLLPNII